MNTSSEKKLGHRRRFPAVVTKWLLLIVASFVVGSLSIALLPSQQSIVVNIGVGINVAMALGIGFVLAWTGAGRWLACAAGLGSVVTVMGWDVLNLTQAEVQGQGWGLGAIPLDVFALPIAALGMTVLLGTGAAAGGIGGLLAARRPCRKWCFRLWTLVS